MFRAVLAAAFFAANGLFNLALAADESVPSDPGGIGFSVQKIVNLSSHNGVGSDQPNAIELPELSAFGLVCSETASLSHLSEDKAVLHIKAPCRPHQAVEIRQSGLGFTEYLPLIGEKTINIPILEPRSQLELVFDDGTQIGVIVPKSDDALNAQVVLEWLGPEPPVLLTSDAIGVQRFGDPRKETDKTLTVVTRAVDTLSPRMVRLTLERSGNCGERHGQVLRSFPGEVAIRQQLRLQEVPCRANSKPLQLKNIIADLRLSRS